MNYFLPLPHDLSPVNHHAFFDEKKTSPSLPPYVTPPRPRTKPASRPHLFLEVQLLFPRLPPLALVENIVAQVPHSDGLGSVVGLRVRSAECSAYYRQVGSYSCWCHALRIKSSISHHVSLKTPLLCSVKEKGAALLSFGWCHRGYHILPPSPKPKRRTNGGLETALEGKRHTE